MLKQRDILPQLSGDLFLTDGGLETTLIFHDGFELPEFAAFTLLKHESGREAMRKYYRRYASIARARGVGFIFESATWRASSSWGSKLGYSAEELADANHTAIDLMRDIRDEFEGGGTPMVLSGCMGSRWDGYNPTDRMSEREAERYHAPQVGTLSNAGVDLISALTMTNAEEAIGLTRAARFAGLPVVISFTVETDGQLPSGQTLGDAVSQVDASTGDAPAYYMINCAHPTHFRESLLAGEEWAERVRGVRANASSKSHAELDEAEELDDGDPVELGVQCNELTGVVQNLNVFGGCCGTDHRHIEEICKTWLSKDRSLSLSASS
jgi:S-methylmethionine-dependent homocysteine/selenocysteine methylase